MGSIDGDQALRLLGLIDAISDCSVPAAYLIQFQRHASDRVRSKAVLMLGRSNCNPGRVRLGELAWHADPTMRCSGAWAMGETGNLQFLAALEKLVEPEIVQAGSGERAEEVEQTEEPENGWLTGRRTTYVRIG